MSFLATTTSILAQVGLNPQPELKVNELSAGRKEIKAIELERCLISSECIGWLRHVYVPKVGENHRPAIKSFTIPQKIQFAADDVHLGSDLDVLVAWHLGLPSLRMVYAMRCYLMNAFSEGLLVVIAPTLGHAS